MQPLGESLVSPVLCGNVNADMNHHSLLDSDARLEYSQDDVDAGANGVTGLAGI